MNFVKLNFLQKYVFLLNLDFYKKKCAFSLNLAFSKNTHSC